MTCGAKRHQSVSVGERAGQHGVGRAGPREGKERRGEAWAQLGRGMRVLAERMEEGWAKGRQTERQQREKNRFDFCLNSFEMNLSCKFKFKQILNLIFLVDFD